MKNKSKRPKELIDLGDGVIINPEHLLVIEEDIHPSDNSKFCRVYMGNMWVSVNKPKEDIVLCLSKYYMVNS